MVESGKLRGRRVPRPLTATAWAQAGALSLGLTLGMFLRHGDVLGLTPPSTISRSFPRCSVPHVPALALEALLFFSTLNDGRYFSKKVSSNFAKTTTPLMIVRDPTEVGRLRCRGELNQHPHATSLLHHGLPQKVRRGVRQVAHTAILPCAAREWKPPFARHSSGIKGTLSEKVLEKGNVLR